MQIVNECACPPGTCYICKSSPEGPYIDTEMEDQFGDSRIYVCFACVQEMGGMFGFLSIKQSDKIKHFAREAQGRMMKAKRELKAVGKLRAILEELSEISSEERAKMLEELKADLGQEPIEIVQEEPKEKKSVIDQILGR